MLNSQAFSFVWKISSHDFIMLAVKFFIFIDDDSMTSSNDSIFIFPFKIQYNWIANECTDEEEKQNHATDDVVVDALLWELSKNKGRKMSALRRKTVIPSVIQLFIYFDVEQGALIQKVNIHKPWGVEDILGT